MSSWPISKFDYQNISQFAGLWLIGGLVCFTLKPLAINPIIGIISPLLICALIVVVINNPVMGNYKYRSVPLLLFFSITITSFFGLTATMTGSYTGSSSLGLYGLSFYTASLAYHFKDKTTLQLSDVLKISNPLLLITGPIALFIKSRRHVSFVRRINYYAPFLIIGIFYYKIIATPLINLFPLIEKTDIASSLLFALIFEIFVYTNFCGLSLIIYAFFGLLGYKVPLNFRQPFSSTNAVEFWRGWHLSLSMVLKSIFYSPIRKKYSSNIAIFAVFIASALWHGISLNYLIWGCFHTAIFIISLYALKIGLKFIPLLLLFVGIILGRLISADSTSERLFEKLSFSYDGMGAFNSIVAAGGSTKIALLIGLVVIMIEFFFQKHRLVAKRNYKFLRTPGALVCIFFVTIFFINSGVNGFAVYGQR